MGSIGRIAAEVNLHNIVADRLDTQSVEFLNVNACSRASCDGTNLRDDRLGVGICRAVRVGVTYLTASDHRELRSRDMHRMAQALVLRDILPGLKRNNSGTSLDVPQEQVACGLRAKVRVVGIERLDQKIALAHQVQAS